MKWMLIVTIMTAQGASVEIVPQLDSKPICESIARKTISVVAKAGRPKCAGIGCSVHKNWKETSVSMKCIDYEG